MNMCGPTTASHNNPALMSCKYENTSFQSLLITLCRVTHADDLPYLNRLADKFPPDNFPPDKFPPDKCPCGQVPFWTNSPRTSSPLDKFPPDKFPWKASI